MSKDLIPQPDDRQAMIDYIAYLETELQARNPVTTPAIITPSVVIRPTPQTEGEWLRQAPPYSTRSITYKTTSTPLPWVILCALIAFAIYVVSTNP